MKLRSETPEFQPYSIQIESLQESNILAILLTHPAIRQYLTLHIQHYQFDPAKLPMLEEYEKYKEQLEAILTSYFLNKGEPLVADESKSS